MKTRATSTSACNFPSRRRCNAQARLGDTWRTFSQTFREFQYTTSVIGFNLLSFAHTSYNGFFFVTLKPLERSQEQGRNSIRNKNSTEPGTQPFAAGDCFRLSSPPAVPGVGTSGGFQFVLEDRAGKDVKVSGDNLNKFLAAARKRPEIGLISTTFIPKRATAVRQCGPGQSTSSRVSRSSDVYQTIQAYMGGLFCQLLQRFWSHLAGIYRGRSV